MTVAAPAIDASIRTGVPSGRVLSRAALEHPAQQVAEGAAFVEAGWDWTTRLVQVDEPIIVDGGQRVRFAYRRPGSNESDEESLVVEVIPDGTISTMHASNSQERHDAPQFRTRIVDG